ncbi:uncharacterized protein LOC132747847 [Ruditapes philippinarum]|uniref:uncharacterized protein LOC132747847 n=1 Tax=Ruditapes philippinarum TaxID=129788 RepID=UPI00295A8287|nr:uncharacterized protein LOC132747847 [Ruditapes philippinarum]
MKLLDLCLLRDIFITVKSWPCLSPIRKAYSRVNSSATLEFTADLKDLETLGRQFEVRFYDGTPKARITFDTDKDPKLEAPSGVSITGDSAGNVVVTLANVQENNAGIYIMINAGFVSKCNCLYILGIPTKPNIILKQIPFVGENATFTCNSTSTTMPSNHSLSLTYTDCSGGIGSGSSNGNGSDSISGSGSSISNGNGSDSISGSGSSISSGSGSGSSGSSSGNSSGNSRVVVVVVMAEVVVEVVVVVW